MLRMTPNFETLRLTFDFKTLRLTLARRQPDAAFRNQLQAPARHQPDARQMPARRQPEAMF